MTLEGHPLPPLRSRKERWLLALLVLQRGEPVSRDWLAQILWPFPDTLDSRARANLQRSLAELRRALGEQAGRLTTPTPHRVAFDLTGADADVLAFERRLAAEDPESLAQAVALYRGPLLAECTEVWVLPEREQREQACRQALERLALRAEEQADHAEAVRWRRQAVSLWPLWEAGWRGLMQALASEGDLNGALETYRSWQERVSRDDPKASPSDETTALYRTLRSQMRASLGLSETPTASSSSAGALPRPLTALIGREAEVAEVVALFPDHRLVTLTGSGGVGKTRLGIAVGEALSGEYRHGVRFVALVPLSAPPVNV